MNHFEEDVKKIIEERKKDIKDIYNKNEDIKDIYNKNEDIKDIEDLILYTNKVHYVKKVQNIKYDDILNHFMTPLFRCNIYTNCVKCKHKKCLYF